MPIVYHVPSLGNSTDTLCDRSFCTQCEPATRNYQMNRKQMILAAKENTYLKYFCLMHPIKWYINNRKLIKQNRQTDG